MKKKTKKVAILDLHSLTRAEAEKKLENFFLNLDSLKMEELKIITGWGKASEPVLFSLVKNWLFEKGYQFYSEPGAFMIELKQGPRKFLSL
ncbi:MAG: Smr/MutS family protein [Candidatus Pacebacteria bacterium]|nr:Smr/MutS family protein [Candidatus Paceibacterota bacterium]